MLKIGKQAKEASLDIAILDENTKNKVLESVSDALLAHEEGIIKANKKDIDNGIKAGLSDALVERLTLNKDRINGMSLGILDVIKLKDPIGTVLSKNTLENGLILEKWVVPLGVVGIIYESRPNVTVDAFALTFKSGNAIILKGGKEAIETNRVLEAIIREVLIEHKLNPNIVQLIKDTNRQATLEFMKMDEYVDVLIPRGSGALIQAVKKESSIPIIETGEGNCHIYVDEFADLKMALPIIRNAKLQRVGVCNAVESLVVHKNIASEFIDLLMSDLSEVEVVGDEFAMKLHPNIHKATPLDFYKEYLDKKMSVKIVDDIDQAITHINTHHTGHSDAIITENKNNADLFTRRIDSAVVYVNASTRFTDGFEFGLGAEMGISTQKLHARGPMGLEALTSYKYVVLGEGQIRK